jgi:hypothetical protein
VGENVVELDGDALALRLGRALPGQLAVDACTLRLCSGAAVLVQRLPQGEAERPRAGGCDQTEEQARSR